MKPLTLFSLIILFSTLISSCCSTKKAENEKFSSFKAGPEVVIYQTRKDYSRFVPVILSDDKKAIESYPGIRDVYYEGHLAYPTLLHKGFWLDNRGITKNVAFLSLTYEEYSKLEQTPSAKELINLILDSEPLTSMYLCGNRSSYREIVKELNSKIDENNFSSFEKIK